MGLAAAGETAALAAIVASRYVSAHTGDPGTTGANEVPSSNGYARVAGGTFAPSGANPTVTDNDAVIEFPLATGSWGTVTHFGLWDASSGGNFIGGDALTASKAIAADDVLRFLAGELNVQID